MSTEKSLKRQSMSRDMRLACLSYHAFHETVPSIMRHVLLHHLTPDVIFLNHEFISSITLPDDDYLKFSWYKEPSCWTLAMMNLSCTGEGQLTWLILATSRLERGTALFST